MKKNQKTVHFLTSAGGRSFLVWGLSAALMTFAHPLMAETPLGGGKFS